MTFKDWLYFYKDVIVGLLIAISIITFIVLGTWYGQKHKLKMINECEIICKHNGFPIAERSKDVCKCFNEPKLFRVKEK